MVWSSSIASVIAQPDLRTATPRGGPTRTIPSHRAKSRGMCAQTVMSSKEIGPARLFWLASFLPSNKSGLTCFE